MRNDSFSIAQLLCCFCLALLALPIPPAYAKDYLIQAGDTLELSVAGVPDLRQRIPVNVQGAASFPLVGDVQAAGKSLKEVRSKVQEILPTKEFRLRTGDGREVPVIVSPQAIDVVIAEYRPIYLNGDVSKPGEVTYRPGLTVRQAIALGGGYDVMRLRMNNPFLEQADIRGEYESQWLEFAKEQAHIARLRAELADQGQLDDKSLIDLPIGRSTADKILSNERELLDVRRTDFANQKNFLTQMLEKQGQRIGMLTEAEAKEKEGVRDDTEDLNRLQDARGRGIVPVTRVIEGRRLLLYSATRALQTGVTLTQADRDRADTELQMKKLDSDRRAQVLAELQQAEVNLAEIRTRLEALSTKLEYVGMVRSQLVSGTDNKPKLTIVRTSEQGAEQINADEDMELRPGDVVEVALTSTLAPKPDTRTQK
ncbi:MAG TPA: polysaccharide biosynthesis/export family protein [Pseudolabrys sp.]|jgi:polysaccharide export outer membrane protein